MNPAIPALLATLITPGLPAGEFEPVSISHSGSFELEISPDKAIHLFTAPGESLWVPGWQPVVLNGDGKEQGTVFLTSHGDESTIWVVVDFDLKARRARYARVAPNSRAGTVEVRVESNGRNGSTVTVGYQLTGLTESGNQHLRHFDDQAYSEMLEEWEHLIRAANIDEQTDLP